MPETFVPLRQWLVPTPIVFATALEAEPEETAPDVPKAEHPYDDLVREVRFFRAALSEAIDEHARLLVREIAVEVVARELQLAPVDIAEVVRSAAARYTHPLAIRVHPDEATSLRAFDNVTVDETMRRGDVNFVVSGGTIDASLGMRLARVLGAVDV